MELVGGKQNQPETLKSLLNCWLVFKYRFQLYFLFWCLFTRGWLVVCLQPVLKEWVFIRVSSFCLMIGELSQQKNVNSIGSHPLDTKSSRPRLQEVLTTNVSQYSQFQNGRDHVSLKSLLRWFWRWFWAVLKVIFTKEDPSDDIEDL